MTRKFFARAARSLLRRPEPALTIVLGTQPGQIWDVRRARWVPESESFRPVTSTGGVDFSMIGPVHRAVELPL